MDAFRVEVRDFSKDHTVTASMTIAVTGRYTTLRDSTDSRSSGVSGSTEAQEAVRISTIRPVRRDRVRQIAAPGLQGHRSDYKHQQRSKGCASYRQSRGMGADVHAIIVPRLYGGLPVASKSTGQSGSRIAHSWPHARSLQALDWSSTAVTGHASACRDEPRRTIEKARLNFWRLNLVSSTTFSHNRHRPFLIQNGHVGKRIDAA